jgi:hypothetical protein
MSMFYKGKFKPNNPPKYKGDPTQIIYRSSWEFKFMRWCDTTSSVLEWQSEETVIPYRCPTDDKLHRYFVDFKIKIRDKNNNIKVYLVEIKPESQTVIPKQSKNRQKYITEMKTYAKNQAKWKAANEYAKDRNWEFMVLTEKNLGIK